MMAQYIDHITAARRDAERAQQRLRMEQVRPVLGLCCDGLVG